jgi:hypothetical protein
MTFARTPKTHRYAESTSVPEAKSRDEIERLLKRYGATGFAYGWEHDYVMLGFRVKERSIRILLPMPGPDDPAFTRTQAGYLRAEKAGRELYEQERRRRWRALALVIKAKLEAVETNISTLEQEFFAHLVLPTGQTMAEWFAPQLARLYDTGSLPPMLPGLPPPEER